MGAFRWVVHFLKSENNTWTSCQVGHLDQVFSGSLKTEVLSFLSAYCFSQEAFFLSFLKIGLGTVLMFPVPIFLAFLGKKNTLCYLGFYYSLTKRQEIWKVASMGEVSKAQETP